jgi:polyisoprenoid-binding protein YceI
MTAPTSDVATLTGTYGVRGPRLPRRREPRQVGRRATIRSAGIDTRNGQRGEHLRSNDFLAMDRYPEITFVSTAVGRTGDKRFEVTGDLTIKGVTNSITVSCTYEGATTDPFGNLRVGFEGSVTINRGDYGVTWNAALETGGVLVSDKIVLEFEVSAIKSN